MENDEEYKTFMKKLENFPNYFQMRAETTNSNHWKKLEKKLNDEKEDFEEMSAMDRFRNLNLFGCVQYYLGDMESAESYFQKVLTESGLTNINASAMMANMYYIQGNIIKSKETLEKLNELAKDPYKIDIAKGELCYAWSRLDPKHYKKGIDELKKLVSKYSDKPEYPIWAFGLALFYRRCLHLSVKSLHPDIDVNQSFKSAKELLENNIHSDDIEPIYKARSYIELADLLASKNIHSDIELPSSSDIYNYIVKGVELAPECASVLMKAGKVMKHIRKYKISEEYLKKANDLRPNSFNSHQLALIKISNITHEKYHKGDHNRHYHYNPNYHAGRFQTHTCPQKSYQDVQKRCGEGSRKWSNGRNKPAWTTTNTRSTPTSHRQDHRIPVVQQLFKSWESSPTVQLDQQTDERGCSTNPDLEEDCAIQERCAPFDFAQSCGSPILEDKVVPDFKKMSLDDLKTTEKFYSDNTQTKHLSTTNDSECILKTCEPKEKGAQPNNALGPSIQPSKTLDQQQKFPFKFSPHAPEFVPLQVEKKMTPIKPTSMKTVMKSPKFRSLGYHKSRKLEPCLELLERSVYYSKNTNFSAYYDWGLLLLQMTPPNFEKALSKFIFIIRHDKSMNVRYKAYEQAGICWMKMSENVGEKDQENHCKNACEMFKRAIRCWADCKRMKLHEYFDDTKKNCYSLCSMREMILGDTSKRNTQQRKDLAHIYYLIMEYGPSLELYEELKSNLQQHSNGHDIEVVKGIINNHLEMKQFNGVLDLLSIFISSEEGFVCHEFKFEVLKKMMDFAIVNNDHTLAASVIDFDKEINFCYNVMILYNKEDPSSKELGKCLGGWLVDIGLKITHNMDDVILGWPKLDGQGIIIGSSRMAVCIINDNNKCDYLHFVMEMTLDDFLTDGRKIFPLCINNSKLANPFKHLKSFCVSNESRFDKQKTDILKAFCDIYLASRNSPTEPQIEAN